MWQALCEQLSDVFDASFSVQDRQLLHKNGQTQCYCVGEQDRYFIKITERAFATQLESEYDGLKRLSQSQTLSVPSPIHFGLSKQNAFLVQHYYPLKPLDVETAFELGQQLARLHQWGEQKEYGLESDNYFHHTLQPNSWDKRWARFFAEQRIGWQLKLCEEKGILFGDIPTITRSVYLRLQNHQPKPALLHGQCHLEQFSRSVQGGMAFQPACYWGDRECDLAMSHYRGQFPLSFYQGYHSLYPLRPSYPERQGLYLLYPILNDCHQSGGNAITHAQRLLDRYQLRSPARLTG